MTTINVKIPDAAAQTKKDLKVKWEEVIRRGLMAIKAERTVVPKSADLDDPYKTKADRQQELSSGAMELEIHLDKRKYNIYVPQLRMWKEVPFDTIIEGQIFRIVEDGKILRYGGHKHLSYFGYPFRNMSGELCMQVVGRQLRL